jgi:hypothetical protein
VSANLSTSENFGAGFDRSGFLGIPSSLNDTDEWSEEEFEERVSQVPRDQLPPRLRRRPSGHDEPGDNGFSFRGPSEVLEGWIEAKQFEGLLFIPGAPFVFPPQRFTAFSTNGTDVLESHPNDAWPQIRIELTRSSDVAPIVQKFLLRPSGNTVDSEILYTRALYTVSNMESCLLASELTADDQVVGVAFSFQPFSDDELARILYRAKIARKLKFIESVFKVRLTLPENITPDHVQYVETIFRGLTEGEFLSRGNGVTVFLKAADVNLSELPLSKAGPYKHYLGTEQALLFPQRVLDVGPYYLIFKRAIVANPAPLSYLREGRDSWVRFEVLDGQITYRYEKYVRPERHRLVQQKLNRFYAALISEEPPELARTVLAPLISDVLPDAAIQIAVGWLQYHSFPDAFSAQNPILDEGRGFWRVPIYVVYSNGKGAPVCEMLIDLKTGSILEEPSPEMLRQQGLALAEKILRVG